MSPPDRVYKQVFDDGEQRWYLNGEWHREDGPAVIQPDGTEFWFQCGKLHRVDGPAITWQDGSIAWWISGNRYFSDESFRHAAGIAEEALTILVLKYGHVH